MILPEPDRTSAHRGLGDRVRALRRAAGLTQGELAAGRFSKEYVSQVERGKTRPSRETLEWLAERLGTDSAYLEHGVSAADSLVAAHALAAAETLSEEHRYDEATAAFQAARRSIAGLDVPALDLRALRGEAWSAIRRGDLTGADALLTDAARVAAHPALSDVDRADIEFLAGVCRYTASDLAGATAAFDRALRLAEQSGLPSDRLRSDIFHWRSRCWRRLRDWEAAREDIDRALELADGRSDPRRAAEAFFQASLVAQREGRLLAARTHAEAARELFASVGDRPTVGRLLNNLAGLNHLLGNPARAVEQLTAAFEMFVDLGLAPEAGYVLSSLADVHLDSGDATLAETQARKALDLLGTRVDHLPEIGAAHLVLGRSLLAQGRLDEAESAIAAAVATFGDASSLSHQADAWIAQGDLAGRNGDAREAARLYRHAAETLLETHL